MATKKKAAKKKHPKMDKYLVSSQDGELKYEAKKLKVPKKKIKEAKEGGKVRSRKKIEAKIKGK